MVKVSVAGALGRMGSRIVSLSLEDPAIRLSGAFERGEQEGIGKDTGSILGMGTLGVILSKSIQDTIEDTDVIIDFTTVESSLENVRVCSKHKKSIVIGTTGFNDSQIDEVRNLGRDIPMVLAPNMSVGVNLLLKVLKDVASILGDDYDIEIIEAHHRLKKDAPSGTAMKMAQVVAEAVQRDLHEVAIYSRKGLIGERAKKEIGIQTIRAGDIVGEHTVIFGGLGERIEITHKASSRDTFARGALRAALWIKDKPPGLYDMQGVLGLK